MSVEDQATADERIPILLQTPAAVWFVSFEPALGPVDFRPWMGGEHCHSCGRGYRDVWDIHDSMWQRVVGTERGLRCSKCFKKEALAHGIEIDLPEPDYVSRIGWIVVGGENGPGARPMHPDWPRSVRDQCAVAGVPFYFKQWGQWAPSSQVAVSHIKGISHAITKSGIVAEFTREAMEAAAPEITQWEGLCRVGKKAAGRLLDGREHNEMPGVG